MNSLAHDTWLILRNDFRLLWRDFRSGRMRAFSSVTLIVIVMAVYQAFTIVMFSVAKTPPPLVAETIVWFFFGFVMLGGAMNNAVTVLFERADFDLLLSSPVSPRAILLARLVAMISAAALTVAFFLLPVIHGAAIGLGPRYLWSYAVWLLSATSITCAGVWFTLLLVRWLGPRRARTWSQVIAALLGATIYIGFQMQNTLSPETRIRVAAKTATTFAHPAFTFVGRAGRGEWRSLLVLTALAGLAVYATTRLLGRIFVTGIQEAAVVKPRTHRHRRYRFRDGLIRATFRKDLRLILRDPLLLSRVLPSVFYLVPALFPLSRLGGLGAAGMLAPFAVVATVMLSSQLTAVSAAGEEGWDLIRLSPASTVTLRLAKIGSGMALPGAIAALVSIAIAVLGRPVLAVLSLATAVISAAGSCWLEVAAMQPTPRKDLIQRGGRRMRTPSPTRIAAAFVFLGVGATAVALAANHYWAFAAVGFGIVLLTAIGCFTLVEMEDIEFEATTTRKARAYDTTT